MVGVVLALISVIAGDLAVAPGVARAATPAISVSPTGLDDGDSVTVSGSGFDGAPYVMVTACVSGAVGLEACATSNTAYAEPDAGSFSVATEAIAIITPGGSVDVDCRLASACEMVAFVSWGDDFELVAVARAGLDFVPDGPLIPPPTVAISPTDSLLDGQRISVSGSGYPPGAFVVAEQCTPASGPDGCRSLDFFDVEADGTFDAGVVVRAGIDYWDRDGESQSRFDCRTSPEPCRLVFNRYDGRPPVVVDIGFDPHGELQPMPAIEASPSTGIIDGEAVTVLGRSFTPDDLVNVELCQVGDEYLCDRSFSVTATVGPDGSFSATVKPYGTFDGWDGPVDCRVAPGCELGVRDNGRDERAAVAIGFAAAPPSLGRYLDPVFDDVEITRDVIYRTTVDHHGNPIELKIDIYQPAGDRAALRPAIMWMHGGWFIFGDREQLAPYAVDAARRGYVAISLQYRLRPDMSTSDLDEVIAAADDAYEDSTAAVEWLQAHAADYRIDPDTIIAAGYSAGAVLAWNMAFLPGQQGPPVPLIAAAVPISGLPFGVAEPGDPPIISFHATDDGILPIGSARDRCAESAAVQVLCEWVEYPSGGHYVIQSQSRDITRRTYDFLATNVLGPHGFLHRPGSWEPGPSPSTTTTMPDGSSPTTSPPATTPPATPTTTPIPGREPAGPSSPAGSPEGPTDPGAEVGTAPRPARPARPITSRPSYAG